MWKYTRITVKKDSNINSKENWIVDRPISLSRLQKQTNFNWWLEPVY